MSERPSIRDELATTIHENFNACRGRNGVSPSALADVILASLVIRRIQAEAIRDAAIKAQEAFVAEQGGIGCARVRTDWLHAEANRIEKGE